LSDHLASLAIFGNRLPVGFHLHRLDAKAHVTQDTTVACGTSEEEPMLASSAGLAVIAAVALALPHFPALLVGGLTAGGVK
jgi:hypothetical protein